MGKPGFQPLPFGVLLLLGAAPFPLAFAFVMSVTRDDPEARRRILAPGYDGIHEIPTNVMVLYGLLIAYSAIWGWRLFARANLHWAPLTFLTVAVGLAGRSRTWPPYSSRRWRLV